ncbi:TPA: hypothetical protein DHW51_18185 [Candidatus Poribacteria bacterium]|nr:hypothetical protein [Candidatus Poribacteria bacterium]
MSQSMSLDRGQAWSPFQANGLHCRNAANSIIPISGNRHLVLYNQFMALHSKPISGFGKRFLLMVD